MSDLLELTRPRVCARCAFSIMVQRVSKKRPWTVGVFKKEGEFSPMFDGRFLKFHHFPAITILVFWILDVTMLRNNVIMIAYRKEKEGNIITKKGEAMHNIGYKRLLVQYIGRQEAEQPIFTTQLTRHVARMTGRDEEDVKKAVNVNMARMEKDGQVVRIEKGVYCKKIRTAFGYYIPDKEAIFCKRLLYDEGEAIGYETGLSMLNRMGLVS